MPENLHTKDTVPTLGAAIQTARKNRGWRVADLAREANLDGSVLVRIESDYIRQPDPRKLARLANALDLPVDRLYNLAGYPIGRQLPSFQPYLRDRYRNLPAPAIEELTRYFEYIQTRYGGADGPHQGEDEQT
jgi:transcriptional regulator with XRE-family HTH domain